MILLMNVDKDNPSVAEGENIQIQGAGITGFEPKGNTKQDSYTGKNLFNASIQAGTYGNAVYTVSSDGLITQSVTDNSGWGAGTNRRFTLNAGTYTISIIGKNSDNKMQLRNITDEEDLVLTSSNTKTFTLDGTKTVAFKTWSGTYPVSYYVQIEQGSATSYEPYVGGIPSPNPDYPQPVKVVTGNNTIKVEGKNLFDKSLIESSFNNRRISTGNGGSYSATGYTISYYLKVQPNTAYTLTTGITSYISWYDENKTYISGTGWSNREAITSPNNASYLRFDFETNNINGVQIEKGSTASDYEEYQSQTYSLNLGSIELCKIGTYQDYIYKDNGKWYKHSEIGKVVLDGTQNITLQSINSYNIANFLVSFANDYTDITKYINMLTNRFSKQTSGISTTQTEGFLPTLNSSNNILGVYLRISSTTASTTTAMNNWLSTHNTEVYYVLATPTNTEITDTELKEDLEAISNIALFEGVNNISMESSNLTSSFKVYYDTWYEFDKILRNGYNIREDRDRITQKFANGHRKQFVSDYVDCSITLNLDTIDKDTTQDYLQRLKSGAYKYYSIDGKEYRTAQFIIENKPELSVENSISNNVDVNEYQITLLKAGD